MILLKKRFSLTSLGWELHWTQELHLGIFHASMDPGTMPGVGHYCSRVTATIRMKILEAVHPWRWEDAQTFLVLSEANTVLSQEVLSEYLLHWNLSLGGFEPLLMKREGIFTNVLASILGTELSAAILESKQDQLVVAAPTWAMHVWNGVHSQSQKPLVQG